MPERRNASMPDETHSGRKSPPTRPPFLTVLDRNTRRRVHCRPTAARRHPPSAGQRRSQSCLDSAPSDSAEGIDNPDRGRYFSTAGQYFRTRRYRTKVLTGSRRRLRRSWRGWVEPPVHGGSERERRAAVRRYPRPTRDHRCGGRVGLRLRRGTRPFYPVWARMVSEVLATLVD